MSGQLVKLKIEAFKDDLFNDEVDNGTFNALFNPESYNLNYQVVNNKTAAHGSSGSKPKYNNKKPTGLNLEFLFDRTGAALGVEKKKDLNIQDDLDAFKRIVFDHNGDIHKPHYLKITWGTLLFKGCLESLDITYKLFSPQGAPLRAVAKANFSDVINSKLNAAKNKNSSPDLTHIRVVKEGDTLPLMTQKIYGDSKYYLHVAKVNKIVNFRKLVAGTKIIFPPIETMANN